MARAIARGATASPSNPVIDLWTLAGGAIADAFAVSFQVLDLSTGTPSQVYPATPGQKHDLDLDGADRLGTGHYAATWTVGGSEPLGRHRVAWYVTQSDGGAEATYYSDIDVLSAGLSLKGPAYCLLSDLRDEGFTASSLADARALSLIRSCSAMVERWTRRFFEPRYRVVTLDGARGRSQFSQDPIIALAEASLDGDVADPGSYKVYNRHIAEGLTNPDDRDNPHVTFDQLTRVNYLFDSNATWQSRQVFWPGPRNVQLSGLWGYTDPDADCQVGVTPDMIRRATMMLVAREMVGIGDVAGRADAQNAYRISDQRTRDQSVTYGPGRSDLAASGGAGEFTGDPAIDDLIAQFVAPPFIGTV